MKDQIVEGESRAGKRTKRGKPDLDPVFTRSTRRAHRRASEDRPLPQLVPVSDHRQLLLFQSFDCDTTRCVLQVPHPLLADGSCNLEERTRVERRAVAVGVRVEAGAVVCSLKGEGGESWGVQLHGKYSWVSEGEVQSKAIRAGRRGVSGEWAEVGRVKVGTAESDLFIVLSMRREEELSTVYRGLINQGNTCYMNSYLQMLFHLTAFRKLLFEAEQREADRFPTTLQLLFYRLLTEQRSGSPQQLVRSFGWSKKEVQVQQDVQEFSCLFFEALEKTVGRVERLFCGQLTHYIQCSHVGTYSPNADFRNQHRERFYDLHLPIAGDLTAALDAYAEEQLLDGDNQYRTDFYGLQDARKGLKLAQLPPVLMLQLKRFQFNPFTESNEKILDRCAYPESLDFGRWTESGVSDPYDLYAVLVHEGIHASSGHYYVVLRVGGEWYRFNDERVQRVEREHALDYNFGGQSEIMEYDSKEMKVYPHSVQNKTTAYMLVYLSRPLMSELLSREPPQFPEWLLKQVSSKQELEQEKKLRKQSICDIPLLSWEKQFQGQPSQGLGLFHRRTEVGNRVETVGRSQKVDEWLLELTRNEREKEVYVYCLTSEKEVLSTARSRPGTLASELFKEIADPYLILAPVSASKEEFLVVVKTFKSDSEDPLAYQCLIAVPKESSFGYLRAQLAAVFPHEPFNAFFLEDKRTGLSELFNTSLELLPSPSPSRNQLLVAVIQRLQEGETRTAETWFKAQLNSINVFLRNEQTKDEWQKEISRDVTAKQIRQIIFQELLDGDQQYVSPQNIVLKYKPKRTSKIMTEAKDADVLKDMVKAERVIVFSFSLLNAGERLLLRELTFRCRTDETLKLSQPIKIVIERAEQQQKLLELIESNPFVTVALPPRKDYGLRMFLLARDRAFISDLIDERCHVVGKGELAVVLDRQKHAQLVIEQYLISTIPAEEATNILLHHVTKTGERIGSPRWLLFNKQTNLGQLREEIVELISNESFEFEGRNYQINPLKVQVLAYVKDIGKAVEIPEASMVAEGEDEEAEKELEIVNDTVEGRFGKCRALRVAIAHNYISRGSQALKLNVQ